MEGKKEKLPKHDLKPVHTYTPRSHEEMLKRLSMNVIKGTDVKDLKCENECLKKELKTLKKELKKFQEKISILESKNNRDENTRDVILQNQPGSKIGVKELDTDDDYVQSWEVLGHHFSEVIRRHNEVLAEKDRQIKELKERPCNREATNNLMDPSIKQNAVKVNKNIIGGKLDYNSTPSEQVHHSRLENNKTGVQDKSHFGWTIAGLSSGIPDDDDQCNCNCNDISECIEYSVRSSGETLSEHFSEVIRRHKQQLQEKDGQIRELQQALECCLGKKTPTKQQDLSEVQIGYYNYHDQPQSNIKALTTSASPSHDRTPDIRAPSDDRVSTAPSLASSDEDPDLGVGSADTFVAMEKCQRLESIANLERMRQNLIQRLELEEKLDKLYWQTEVNRYHKLREEAGDSFNPECSFNKDFDMLESTRLELLRALKDVKDSAKAGPDLYVVPHLPVEDSENTLMNQVEYTDYDGMRRVTFTEEVRITSVQTTYDS